MEEKNCKNTIFQLKITTMNNRNAFLYDVDMEFLLRLLRIFVNANKIKIHCYCLLKSEIALIIELDKKSINLFLHNFLTLYERYFFNKYKCDLPLFNRKYYLKFIEDDKTYLFCLKETLLKPQTKKISLAFKYKWSSLGEYVNNSFVYIDYSLSFFKSKEFFFHYILGKKDGDWEFLIGLRCLKNSKFTKQIENFNFKERTICERKKVDHSRKHILAPLYDKNNCYFSSHRKKYYHYFFI